MNILMLMLALLYGLACRPFGFAADVDESRLAARLHLVGQSHRLSEQAVARHLRSDDAGHHGTGVDADAHLQQRRKPHTQRKDRNRLFRARCGLAATQN